MFSPRICLAELIKAVARENEQRQLEIRIQTSYADFLEAIRCYKDGLRATLFGDPRLRTKQILMTSHSNEFIKDIQNQLGQQTRKLYVLDHQPRVQGGSDRHYLIRAREHLNQQNVLVPVSCRKSWSSCASIRESL